MHFSSGERLKICKVLADSERSSYTLYSGDSACLGWAFFLPNVLLGSLDLEIRYLDSSLWRPSLALYRIKWACFLLEELKYWWGFELELWVGAHHLTMTSGWIGFGEMNMRLVEPLVAENQSYPFSGDKVKRGPYALIQWKSGPQHRKS